MSQSENSRKMMEGHNQTEADEERLRSRLISKKESRRQESEERERRPDRRRDDGPGRHRRGPGPPYRRGGPPPAPHHYRGPPMRGRPPYGRGPPMPGPPDRRRRSYTPRSYDSSSEDGSRRRSRSRGRSRSRSSHSSYSRSRSRSYSSHSSEESDASSVSSRGSRRNEDNAQASLTKDQRTIFVSQLVMRADERDVRRYFRRQVGCKVNEISMLRDKRSGRHKGCAYVELGRLEDVPKAVAVNNEAPDFQRFPILVKPSEAEKNYVVSSSSLTVTASQMGVKAPTGPLVGPDGKLQESQKVYLGGLDPRVTQEQLFTLFSPFGLLEKVNLQMEPVTGVSKGFAFLSYRDPKEANLAIQTMSGQLVAGKPIKTGWASQPATTSNVEVVTSYEFPDDAPTRIQNAHLVLAQLTGAGLTGAAAATAAVVSPVGSEQIASAAEAAINAALGLPPETSAAPIAPQVAISSASPASVIDDPKMIGNSDSPTQHLLVRNMFDKDEETEAGWADEIRVDFEEECAKYGKIVSVVVMSTEPGGKVYASFESIDGAKSCASDLAGRWFDKRQLRVQYVKKEDIPKKE